MPRSSRSVSLVLLGSAAFLAGCSRDPEWEAQQSWDDAEKGVANYHDPSSGHGGTGYHGGGHYRGPIIIPVPMGGGGIRSNPGGGSGGGGGGGVSSPGGTTRGGFGSMGHSAGS